MFFNIIYVLFILFSFIDAYEDGSKSFIDVLENEDDCIILKNIRCWIININIGFRILFVFCIFTLISACYNESFDFINRRITNCRLTFYNNKDYDRFKNN